MKINKAFADLMLQSFRPNYADSNINATGGIVLSLWSGTPMDQTNMNTIRDTLTDANGTIQGNWPAITMAPNDRTELARLFTGSFTERADSGATDKRFRFSKVQTPMTILSAGTVGSFTIGMVASNWAGYTNVAANRGRVIFSGSVSDLEGSGELKLSTLNLLASTILYANDVIFQFEIPSLELVW